MNESKYRNPSGLPEFVFDIHYPTGTLYDLLPFDLHEPDSSNRGVRSLVACAQDAGVCADSAQLMAIFQSDPPLGAYPGEVADPFRVTLFPRRTPWKRRAAVGRSSITIERARRILIEAGYRVEMPA
jgi:hypothetical protein